MPVMRAFDQDRKARDEEKSVSRFGIFFESLTRREREVLTLVIFRPDEQADLIPAGDQRNHRESPRQVMKKMEARSLAVS